MAKKPNAKRAARIEKNNRNMNRATAWVTAGFFAEIYLLILSRFFVDGTVPQVVAASEYLEVVRWVGLAILAVGAVLLLSRKQTGFLTKLGVLLLAVGLFLAVSSFLMLSIYPQGTRAMCVAVPVAVLLGIVFLLYPHEFSVQALGLAASLGALFLLNKGLAKPGWRTLLLIAAVLVLLLLAALALCSHMVRGNGGVLALGQRKFRLYGERTNYTLLYGVLAVCFAAVLLGMFVSGAAFYGMWTLAVLTFALAVYYTIKVM